VAPQDFDRFHYILAMDRDNLANLRRLQPVDFNGELSLFLDFANVGHDEVPDPYYGGDSGFDLVLDLVEQASAGLLAEIRRSRL
jgi:protein-tyrosine phosphatase